MTEEHFAYLAERTARDDAFLRELKREAERAGLPAIWIAPEQASFLQILLRIGGAREVVEVGTLGGYSAIAMARALPAGGRVRTIEISPGHAAFAREWIARSDVAEKIEVLEGDGAQLLAAFADGSADAAFIDADKEGYVTYLEQCLRIVRRGGIVLADNAFGFGRLFEPEGGEGEGVGAIRRFNDRMASEGRLQSVICPLGDGVWVGVVL